MRTLQKMLMMACVCLFPVTMKGQNNTGQNLITDKKEQLPAFTDWFLSTGDWQNDPQLYVYEFGTGTETIVMLHGGWGGDYSGLLESIKNFEKEYRFVFYDQRGSLRSPFPDSMITFNEHIEDLERLRKALGEEKMSIVGHSMGGVLASAYATKYPQQIKSLILLAPAYLKNPISGEDADLLRKDAQFQTFLNRPSVINEINKYSLNRASPPLTSQEETCKFRINFAKRMLYDVSNWPKLQGGRALYKGNVFELTAKTYPAGGWDYVQEFKKNGYPVSIIVGDHDFLDFGNNLIKKWAIEAPSVKLTTINNAGHLIWLDQPEEFEKQLAKHLKNIHER